MCVLDVGVSQAESVARRCPDGKPEQVADASHIAAGEVQFLQDPVFSQCLRPKVVLCQRNYLRTG